jgi:tRNA threonylcarbamoyladenosine biosynthesis protein TsaE
MATKTALSISLRNIEDTKKLALVIANQVVHNGIKMLVLAGDLGAGKTTFTKFFSEAMGSGDVVSSPTFVIEKQYQAKNFTIVHLDLYRIGYDGDMALSMRDHLQTKNTVVVAEWADLYESCFPEVFMRLDFQTSPTNEGGREVQVEYSYSRPTPIVQEFLLAASRL